MRIKALLYLIALMGGTAITLFLPSIQQMALGHHGALAQSAGAAEDGKVVGVLSGDTLVIQTASGRRVRATIWGIAAPDRLQAYGEAAKRSLSDLAFGKPVRVRIEGSTDSEHVLATLYTGSLNVGSAQTGRGLAWVTNAGGRDTELSNAQRSARTRQAGLWRDSDPVAPWDFKAQR
jgi:micrococcal nuclease